MVGWEVAGIAPLKTITLGDSKPLPADICYECLKIFEEECVAIPWKKGDVLLIDNWAELHARRPTNSPRHVLASLCKWHGLRRQSQGLHKYNRATCQPDKDLESLEDRIVGWMLALRWVPWDTWKDIKNICSVTVDVTKKVKERDLDVERVQSFVVIRSIPFVADVRSPQELSVEGIAGEEAEEEAIEVIM
ncbi:hypothetical protein Ddye_014464 [Dipteronia dyeriana]|uniref:TauD/TfdA-like domain-containing protein n=1 Tax=Dipteronia dyeriana TaxID=168575 RepID=A0AAD9X8W5_9ROSI|nr:hypothetical protein Ddye_014464 [Dipteronia dyeriana]